MPKPKKTPKAQTQNPLPPALLAIAALVGEAHHPGELRDALAVAQKAIQRTPGEYADDIHAYITHSAKTGSFKDDVLKAETFDSKDVDVHGGLHNAFATPALLAGMAVAFCVLTNNGGAK